MERICELMLTTFAVVCFCSALSFLLYQTAEINQTIVKLQKTEWTVWTSSKEIRSECRRMLIQNSRTGEYEELAIYMGRN